MTEPMTLESDSPEKTFLIGERLGEKLPGGTVLCLTGDLGAGKTSFVQGMAKGLKVTDAVTSPTFNIMNIYEGRLPLVHFDLYRLESAFELDDIDFRGFVDEPAGVVVVEWAEKFPSAMPEKRIDISFTIGDSATERRLTINASDDYSGILKELAEKC